MGNSLSQREREVMEVYMNLSSDIKGRKSLQEQILKEAIQMLQCATY